MLSPDGSSGVEHNGFPLLAAGAWMPGDGNVTEALLPNQKVTIARKISLGGFLVTLPQQTPMVIEALNGDVPWIDWVDQDTIAKVTTRKRAKP